MSGPYEPGTRIRIYIPPEEPIDVEVRGADGEWLEGYSDGDGYAYIVNLSHVVLIRVLERPPL